MKREVVNGKEEKLKKRGRGDVLQEISRVRSSHCFGQLAWVGAWEAAGGCCGVLPPDPGQNRALSAHSNRQFLLSTSLQHIFPSKHVLALFGFQRETRMCFKAWLHPSLAR